MTETVKPHKGRIDCWSKYPVDGVGLGYRILGRFLDHPAFAGMLGHTSYVISHDQETGEIETLNSRYTLIDGNGTK